MARANCLSNDRPDIQFAVKKLATSMSNPTNRNWQELKRLGRYLKGKPRLVRNQIRLARTNHCPDIIQRQRLGR